jgi:hypothetical protein
MKGTGDSRQLLPLAMLVALTAGLILSGRNIRLTTIARIHHELSGDEEIKLAPNGSTMLIAEDGTLKVYSLPSGRLLWSRRGGAATYLPNSKDVIFSQGNKILACLAAKNSHPKGIIRGHGSHAPIAVSPNGDTVFSTDGPHSIAAWSLKSGRRLWSRVPKLGPDISTFGDLHLLGLQSGGCALVDNQPEDGEPIRCTWSLVIYDAKGRQKGRQESNAYFESLSDPVELRKDEITSVAQMPTSSLVKSFHVPGLRAAKTPRLSPDGLSNIWKGGQWIFAEKEDLALVAMPLSGGTPAECRLMRPESDVNGGSEEYPVGLIDVSADGRTIAFDYDDNILVQRISIR